MSDKKPSELMREVLEKGTLTIIPIPTDETKPPSDTAFSRALSKGQIKTHLANDNNAPH